MSSELEPTGRPVPTVQAAPPRTGETVAILVDGPWGRWMLTAKDPTDVSLETEINRHERTFDFGTLTSPVEIAAQDVMLTLTVRIRDGYTIQVLDKKGS